MPRWPAGGLAAVVAAALLIALACAIGMGFGVGVGQASPPRVDAGGAG